MTDLYKEYRNIKKKYLNLKINFISGGGFRSQWESKRKECISLSPDLKFKYKNGEYATLFYTARKTDTNTYYIFFFLDREGNSIIEYEFNLNRAEFTLLFIDDKLVDDDDDDADADKDIFIEKKLRPYIEKKLIPNIAIFEEEKRLEQERVEEEKRLEQERVEEGKRLEEENRLDILDEMDLVLYIRHMQDDAIYNNPSQTDVDLKNGLYYVGSGVPNAVYYDTELDGVVKFHKHEIDTVPNLKITDGPIESWESIKINFNDIKTFVKSEDKYNIKIFINQLIKTQEIYKQTKELHTFLKIKGHVIYNNLENDYIRALKCESEIYEYIYDLELLYTVNLNNTNYEKFLNVLKDFKTLNMNGYFHGDLQTNCRNMGYSKIKENFVIFDIDSISTLFYNDILNMNFFSRRVFEDIISLIECINTKLVPTKLIKLEEYETKIDNFWKTFSIQKDAVYYKIVNTSTEPYVRFDEAVYDSKENIEHFNEQRDNYNFRNIGIGKEIVRKLVNIKLDELYTTLLIDFENKFKKTELKPMTSCNRFSQDDLYYL